MSSVLFTTHHLKDFAGSEINILELAKTFIKLNFDVSIATFEFGHPIKEEFNKLDITIFDLLDETNSFEKEYDLIWAQHTPSLLSVLFKYKVTGKQIVYSSLSTYEPLEIPPIFLQRFVSLFLANSSETEKNIIKLGIAKENVAQLKNFVLDDFFEYTPKLPEKILKVAIVSNHIPNEVIDTVPIFEKNNIDVDIFGKEGKVTLVTPELLLNYDTVITIGKTVQYCMTLGIPVFCYDRFGGEGWITLENLVTSEEFNFSGRGRRIKLSSEEIFSHIVYKHNFKDLKALRDIAEERYKLSSNIERILTTLSTNTVKKQKRNNEFFHYINTIVPYYIKQIVAFREQGAKFQKSLVTTQNSLTKIQHSHTQEKSENSRLSLELDSSQKKTTYIIELLDQKLFENKKLESIIGDNNSFIKKLQLDNQTLNQHNRQLKRIEVMFKEKEREVNNLKKDLETKSSLINITQEKLLQREKDLETKSSLINITQEKLLQREKEINKLRLEINHNNRENLKRINRLEIELTDILSSKSWTLTRPLRRVMRYFK